MEKTKKKDTGWRNYYQIANSNGTRCGNMKCHKCKKTIQGNYLIRDKQNFMHRGNETDERYLYHRNCSNNKSIWENFDREEAERKDKLKLRQKQKKEVMALINKYGFEADDLFDVDYHY